MTSPDWESYLRSQADPYYIPEGRAFGSAQGQLIDARPMLGRRYGHGAQGLGYLDTYRYGYGSRFLQSQPLGDIAADAKGIVGEGKAGLDTANENIKSANELVGEVEKATSGIEDFFLWFSSWSGPPITAPAISDNINPKTPGLGWRPKTGQAFVESLQQGAIYDTKGKSAVYPGPTYKMFNFKGPPRLNKPSDAHVWDLKTGAWVISANASPDALVVADAKAGKPPGTSFKSLTTAQGDQHTVNSQASNMDGQLLAFQAAPSKAKAESLIRQLVQMSSTQRAIAGGLMVTAGPKLGQSYKTLNAAWVKALAPLVASLPAALQPYNAAALKAAALTVKPDNGDEPTKTTGAAAGIGLAAVAFMLWKMFG